ncbi:MAG: homoserine O-succinyltransferase, partial [Clostridia bacterium]|nr:homoserine O-succinyltransferase [Clostridia bacterium]
ILASSEETGVYICMTEKGKQIFVMNHPEYDPETLKNEYVRDKNAGLPIDLPKHYFENDDETKSPVVTWRGCANLLYSNWLNYFVYQSTPYERSNIQ